MNEDKRKYVALEFMVVALLACFFVWLFIKIMYL